MGKTFENTYLPQWQHRRGRWRFLGNVVPRRRAASLLPLRFDTKVSRENERNAATERFGGAFWLISGPFDLSKFVGNNNYK